MVFNVEMSNWWITNQKFSSLSRFRSMVRCAIWKSGFMGDSRLRRTRLVFSRTLLDALKRYIECLLPREENENPQKINTNACNESCCSYDTK